MKRVLLTLMMALTLLMTGCLKDNPNMGTIVLTGTESYVVPLEELGVDTLLAFLSVNQIELPTGNMPPDVQGEFMLFPRELYADNGHHPLAGDTLFFRFGGDADTLTMDTLSVAYYPEGQHNRWMPCDIHEKGFSRKHVDNAYVMGNGDEFTAYFIVPYDDCYESGSGVYYTLTRGYIITGTITDTGIDQVKVACVNISAEPNNPSEYIPSNAFRLIVDRIYLYRVNTGDSSNPFGSAVRQQWYPN